MQSEPPRTEKPPPPHSGDSRDVYRVSSTELLGPRGEIVIEHRGREYRLRVTQNGKLILTA
jgi:hemin uptake protein HemP